MPLLESLYSFVQAKSNDLGSSLVESHNEVPLYWQRVKTCVKYADIENEIRCGQYYLRIWAEQYRDTNDQFDETYAQEPKIEQVTFAVSAEQNSAFMKSLILTFSETVKQLRESGDVSEIIKTFKREMEKIKIIIKACLLAQQKLETRENE